MTKSQLNCNWIERIYQDKTYQSEIFIGFEYEELSKMAIMINAFVENIDLSFFKEYYKANNIIGGRPNLDYAVLLKIYLYSLYKGFSIRTLNEHNALGSNLHYLSQGLKRLPQKSAFTNFLKVLDNHIDAIFDLSIEYLKTFLTLKTADVYCDGTVFEACNSRYRIITDTNIKRSNTKWQKVLTDELSSPEDKAKARIKLKLNQKRWGKLMTLDRQSYGRTDPDSVLLMDKNGRFIAGFNVQFVEESNYGFIIFTHISNKNPDSEVFKEMAPTLFNKHNITNITLDNGYGTTEILEIIDGYEVTPTVIPRTGKNSTKKITDYDFVLTDDNESLICPNNRELKAIKTNDKGLTTFKSSDCLNCELRNACQPRSKLKSVVINIKDFRLICNAETIINSNDGKERYSHRANLCESPHGFIIYNLRGKKLKMKGLVRNNTIIKLYAIIFNLRRLISIKSSQN